MPEMVAVMPPKLGGRLIHGERKYTTEKLDEWLDGHARKFSKGVDFDCKAVSFGSLLRSRASERGLKSTVRVRGNHLYFQVTGPDK